MSGIRINKLCHQLNIGKKELIAFLSSKGIMVSSNPNFKVPESAIPLLQKEYGYIENTETIARTLEENLPFECVPLETKTKPTKSKILPDSPFRIGTSGKFKLLIKNIEEKLGDYEYLLVDADGKEYKTISKDLYVVGQILRCMVYFKVERARLVVENVAVCNKQDLATPILIAKKPTPTKATAPIATPKAKTKAKTKTKKQGKQKKSNNRAVERKGIYDSYRRQKAEEALAFLDSIKATDTAPIREENTIKKQQAIKSNESTVQRQLSSLSTLIQTQRGKRFSGVFTCAKCFNKHTTGYLFTDEDDNEYEVCAYCCREKKDYSYIIYTAMGNG